MNKFRRILVFGILTFSLAITATTVWSKKAMPITGQVVVKSNSEQIPDTLLARFKGRVKDKIPGKKTFLINFPPVIPVDVVIQALENSPKVDYAEPNYEIDIADPLQISISSPDQYAPPLLLRSSPSNYYAQQSNLNIGLESALLLSTGERVTVAVIDNGLDYGHPLFKGRINANGYDFVDDDSDPSEVDGAVLGHGTFVSGLIMLIAPNSKIMPIRSFNENGVGTSFLIAKGLQHAVEHNADIVNMSFGLEFQSQLLDSAIAAALSFGITMVASSGNDGKGQVMYPAAQPGVIAVSAIDSLDLIAEFSNYGEFLDLGAPGVNLYSSMAGQYEWGWWSGTSFSASVVSGAAALVMSRRPGLSPFDMQLLFQSTSQTELNWGSVSPPDSLYGYGVVNAFSSLMAVGRGDLNNSGRVDITDLTKYVDFFFREGELPASPKLVADFNCDNDINILDFTGVVDYLFRFGDILDPCF